MSRDSWIKIMWLWTFIPFAVCVVAAVSFVVYKLAEYLLGNPKAIDGDGFKFCTYFLIWSVPFYVLIRSNRFFLEKRKRMRDDQ